jgi:predicted PurR-regulated permease PerM
VATKRHPHNPSAESDEAIPAIELKQPLSRWTKMFVVALAALILALGSLVFIWFIARPIGLFLLALTIATALAPIVHFLERYLRRTAAVVVVFLGLVLVLMLIGFIVIPPFVEQVELVAVRVPELVERLELFINRWLRIADVNLTEMFMAQAGNLAGQLWTLPINIIYFLLEGFVVIFLAIYMLIEAPAIRGFVLSLFPDRQDERTAKVLDEMTHSMGGYVRGVLMSGSAVGVMAAVGTWAMGLNYPMALGVFAAMMEVFPYVGPAIAGIPIIVLAFMESPTLGAVAIVFWLAVQQIESNILLPNIMRSQTEVSPLLVLLALAAGYAMGGLMGAIVAIPVTAALRVFIVMVLAPAIRRRTGATADAAHRVKVEHRPD